MTDYLLRLPWPHSDLSKNARVHRMRLHRVFQGAKSDAARMTKAQHIPAMPNAILEFCYYPPHRRYDVQNIAHMVAAYIDGIADGMGVKNDKGFEVRYPSRIADVSKKNGGAVLVHIKSREKTMANFLQSLNLSVRAYNVCARYLDVNTLQDFLALDRMTVLRQHNAGGKTWKEIAEKQEELRANGSAYDPEVAAQELIGELNQALADAPSLLVSSKDGRSLSLFKKLEP